ncbi:MFS general substrate transporter [Nemania abortiva]|nr:MFS general substrate transporter [Nemania abortiva]
MATRTVSVEAGPSITLQGQSISESVLLPDKENPQKWPPLKKWVYTFIVVGMAGIVGFSSSVHTPAVKAIAIELNTSNLISTLGSTTYLVGFGFGPFLFSPLSEVLGRNPIYYLTFITFVLANVGCALSPNIVSLLVFRFIAGFFGSPSVANSGGTITDLWPQSQRSVPFAFFTVASFCGPVLAPIVGGFLTQYISWRWNFWIVVIISAVIYLAVVVALPETYAPRLINKRHTSLGTSQGRAEPWPLRVRYSKSLSRPWAMLFTEPILFSLSLYMAFVYGVLFLDFTSYPLIFQESRGWSVAISGLSFLGIGFGMAVAAAVSPFVDKIHSRYTRILGAPHPETRLPHLIVIAWLLPVSLFWFGWTALPPIHWSISIVSGVFFGFGLVLIFLGISAYLTDCYDEFSASALAANSMLRALFGAGFAVFAKDLYEKLGTPWATSLLGFVAAVLALLQPVFYKYGPKLRAASALHRQTKAVSVTRSSQDTLHVETCERDRGGL